MKMNIDQIIHDSDLSKLGVLFSIMVERDVLLTYVNASELVDIKKARYDGSSRGFVVREELFCGQVIGVYSCIRKPHVRFVPLERNVLRGNVWIVKGGYGVL